jgi:hypothetical protein
MESQGGRDGYDESKKLDWKVPLTYISAIQMKNMQKY